MAHYQVLRSTAPRTTSRRRRFAPSSTLVTQSCARPSWRACPRASRIWRTASRATAPPTSTAVRRTSYLMASWCVIRSWSMKGNGSHQRDWDRVEIALSGRRHGGQRARAALVWHEARAELARCVQCVGKWRERRFTASWLASSARILISGDRLVAMHHHQTMRLID